MASYSRSCKKCGIRINLRQMPSGQWVAFEGYDVQHKCGTTGRQATRSSSHANAPRNPRTETGTYDNLEFGDIQVQSNSSDHLAAKSSPSVQNPSQANLRKPTVAGGTAPSSLPKSSSIPTWIWWVAGAVLLLWVFRS